MLVLVLEFSRISARCSTHARNCHVRNVEGPAVHEWTSTEERRSSKTEDESPDTHHPRHATRARHQGDGAD